MDRLKVSVLYGSETGTAKEVAERIFRDAKRHHFSARVSALDDYNVVRVMLLRRIHSWGVLAPTPETSWLAPTPDLNHGTWNRQIVEFCWLNLSLNAR